MSLTTLTRGLAEVPNALRDLSISDLTLDSRSVANGACFIAVKGSSVDGRHYIDDALRRGAVAVLADDADSSQGDPRVIPVADLKSRVGNIAKRFYDDPSRKLSLLAVTGTNGKTSITDYIGQLLRLVGESAGTIGTLGARTRSGEALEARNTTPDVVSMNRQLAQWSKQGIGCAAIEASSHALDQGRLDGLTVHTAVFSNLTRDHLDYHGSFEAYKRAKLRLFSELSPEKIIFNADDSAAYEAKSFSSGAALGISLNNHQADVYVQLSGDGSAGVAFQLHSPFGSGEVRTALQGHFNAFNVAAAVVSVCGLGFPFKQVASAANHILPVEGRMQRAAGPEDVRVIVDYAHTPDALQNVLQALSASCKRQLWVVFGCGGDRDIGKRAEMGRIATQFASRVIITNDNPRTEDASTIADQIVAGCGGADVTVELDRARAIACAIKSAGSGDTIVIAGKGHENYQIIGNVRTPFSDIECAENLLATRGASYA